MHVVNFSTVQFRYVRLFSNRKFQIIKLSSKLSYKQITFPNLTLGPFCQGVLAPIWHPTGPSCLRNLPSSLRTFPTKYVSCQQQQALNMHELFLHWGWNLMKPQTCWNVDQILSPFQNSQMPMLHFLPIWFSPGSGGPRLLRSDLFLLTLAQNLAHNQLVDFIQNVNLLKCAWGNEPITWK